VVVPRVQPGDRRWPRPVHRRPAAGVADQDARARAPREAV